MYHDLETLLHMERRFVGIKLLSKSQMRLYEEADFETVKHKAYYCWLVKKATEGRAFKLTFDQFACETAGWVLGLAPENIFGNHEENIVGWHQCGTYASEKVAKLIYEGIKPLKRSEGILIGPLHAFSEDLKPDVVIIVGNPYTIMRIIQGYSATQGFATEIKLSGMCGICFETTAHPMQTQSLSVSTLCSGTRYFAKWKSEEMSVGIPFACLDALERGVHQTMNPCEPDHRKKRIELHLKKPLKIQYKSNYYIKRSV